MAPKSAAKNETLENSVGPDAEVVFAAGIDANATGLAKMRQPFPKNQVSRMCRSTKKENPKGQCQKCGGWHGLPSIQLDYVGHAALTDRLLDADPAWQWEFAAVDANGLPVLDANGGLWIKLTVCGVTRLGYGDAEDKKGPAAMKERIGDALRNAAMRFGAALELWHKGDLHAHLAEQEAEERAAQAEQGRQQAEAAERARLKAEKDAAAAAAGPLTESELADHDAEFKAAVDYESIRTLYSKAYRRAQAAGANDQLKSLMGWYDAAKNRLAAAGVKVPGVTTAA